MPLQQLVAHFNDRFEKEHHSSFRPFTVERGVVNGLFGPIRIGSVFLPIRHAANTESIAGNVVQLTVSTHNTGSQAVQGSDFGSFVTDTINLVDFQSIIDLDRLCRTVHMLNYLPYADVGGELFLDVDPRHILAVKQDHGAYFEEIIVKCGLATKNIVISLAVNSFYVLNHAQLLEGLNNYRQRGYQIALNVGNLYSANGLVDFIGKLSPKFLRVNAPHSDTGQDWPSAITALKELQGLVGNQIILQQVARKEQADIASAVGFEWVQGSYYDKLAEDYLRCM